jgi:hypothetical protein
MYLLFAKFIAKIARIAASQLFLRAMLCAKSSYLSEFVFIKDQVQFFVDLGDRIDARVARIEALSYGMVPPAMPQKSDAIKCPKREKRTQKEEDVLIYYPRRQNLRQSLLKNKQ